MKTLLLIIGLALAIYSLYRIGKGLSAAEFTQFDAGSLVGHALLLIVGLILLAASRSRSSTGK